MNQGTPQPFYQGQPMQQPQPQPYQQPFYLPNPAQRFDEMSMAQNSQIPMRQPMPMYQQPQQPMQQAGTQPAQAQTQQLTGRYVGDYREILPKEVPMDGTVGFFPTNDMTRIYVKAWTPDGRVVGIKFIPDPDQSEVTSQVSQAPNQEVYDRLDRLEKLVASISTQTETTTKAKKGG